MIRLLRRRLFIHAAAAGTLVAGFAGASGLRGDDLTTLSGVFYHDVRPVRIEPDGVTWQYDEGIAKVDFSDSPKKICQDYHYDPAKAEAYRASFAQARQQADEQSRAILQQDAQRRAARMQAAAAQGDAHPSEDMKLVFQRATSPAASDATRALGARMEAAVAAKAVQPTGVFGAVAHSPVGTVLSMLGVSFYQGPSVLNEGPQVANQNEFQSGLHHPKGTGPAADAAHDAFYTPNYSTKSYFDDVERSEALLRGVPLKP